VRNICYSIDGAELRNGIDYDTKLFPNPEEFRPSRWYTADADISSEISISPPDSGAASVPFTSFGIGPRACIGKKFAVVEATCFLALLLRDYKLRIGDQREGESRKMWRERRMQGRMELTFQPESIPIVLERR
jgi:cytochrome P450